MSRIRVAEYRTSWPDGLRYLRPEFAQGSHRWSVTLTVREPALDDDGAPKLGEDGKPLDEVREQTLTAKAPIPLAAMRNLAMRAIDEMVPHGRTLTDAKMLFYVISK